MIVILLFMSFCHSGEPIPRAEYTPDENQTW